MGNVFGPARGQQTTAGPTSQNMQDKLDLQIGVRMEDSLTQLEAFTGRMRDVGRETEGTSSSLRNMWGMLSRGAGWLGIGIGLNEVIGKLMDTQQAFQDMEKSMYGVGMEATRGGGLLMSWADTANEVAISAVKNLYIEMTTAYRLTDKEISSLLSTVAQSGVGFTKVIGGTVDEVTSSINEVIQATRDAFVLQSVGFSPDQIKSLYHDMAVNLQLDTKAMRQEFLGFLTVASQIPLSLHEQIGVVTDLMAQYSKFGITMGEVVRNMDAIVAENSKVAGSYTNVGLSIDQMRARMGLLTAGSPQERATLMATLSPEQRQRVLFGETTGAAREALTERYRGLWQSSGLAAAGANFEEFVQGRGDMRAYGLSPMWGAYPTEGRSLAVAYGMQNMQQRMGGGPEAIYNLELMMKQLFPGLMAEFESIKFRGGKPAEDIITSDLKSFGKTMEDKVAEVKEQMRKQGIDPITLPTDADAYFKTAGDKLSDIVKETTGARQDAQHMWRLLWLAITKPSDAGNILDELAGSPKVLLGRLQERMIEAPAKTEALREAQIATVEAIASKLALEGIDMSGVVDSYKKRMRAIEGELTERSLGSLRGPEETLRTKIWKEAGEFKKESRTLGMPYDLPQETYVPEYYMRLDEFKSFMATQNPNAVRVLKQLMGVSVDASIEDTYSAMIRGVVGKLSEEKEAGVPIRTKYPRVTREIEEIPKSDLPGDVNVDELLRDRGATLPGGGGKSGKIGTPADQSYLPTGTGDQTIVGPATKIEIVLADGERVIGRISNQARYNDIATTRQEYYG